MVSQFGFSITSFVIPWLIMNVTGSPFHMGMVWGLGYLSYLIFSFPAGVWIDRYNRKMLLIVSDIGRMMLLLILVYLFITDDASIWSLYLIRIGISLFSSIFDNCYIAAMPNLIDKEDLYKANGHIMSTTSIVQIVGTAIAGFLVAQFGVTTTLIIDVVTYLVSIICILVIKGEFAKHKPPKKNMFIELKEGIQYTWNLKIIRYFALLTMGVNLSLQAGLAVLIYRLEIEIGLSTKVSSLIFAGMTFGVFLGSLCVDFVLKRFSIKSVTLLCFAVFTLSYFALSIVSSPILIVICETILGIWVTIWNVQVGSMRQKIVPNELLGRVGSAARSIAYVSIPIGASIGGILAEKTGVQFVFVLCGAISLLITMYCFFIKNDVYTKHEERIAS